MREVMMQLRKRLADICQSNTARIVAWVVAWIVVVLIVVVVFSVYFWCWLVADESGSTTIRNLGLVVAAMIGLPLAIWRSIVAERQSATAQRQSETAQRQSETAQSSLLNERYQKGAEMLGSKVLAVRLGGIYALDRLAREYPGNYHTQIMSLFCALVCNPPAELNRDGGEEGNSRLPGMLTDGQAVMRAVGMRNGSQIETEKKEEFRLGLFKADLKDLYLSSANLSRVDLGGADLSGAQLLDDTNLSETFLLGVNLSGAFLDGTDLRNCTGLTQKELDRATANPDNPPKLEGVVDAETGKPLVWRGDKKALDLVTHLQGLFAP